jgi:hypothetical protein
MCLFDQHLRRGINPIRNRAQEAGALLSRGRCNRSVGICRRNYRAIDVCDRRRVERRFERTTVARIIGMKDIPANLGD